MKSMKKDFRMVASGLKALARKTEQIAKKVDEFEKADTVKKPKTKVKAKTTKKVHLKKKATKKAPAKKKAVVRKAKTSTSTATGRILNTVKKFKKGVDVPVLAKKTRYNDKKIRDILSRAFAQGRVRRVGRGLYAAA
jgi:hypothetical protein